MSIKFGRGWQNACLAQLHTPFLIYFIGTSALSPRGVCAKFSLMKEFSTVFCAHHWSLHQAYLGELILTPGSRFWLW